jgi:hypothetical protein
MNRSLLSRNGIPSMLLAAAISLSARAQPAQPQPQNPPAAPKPVGLLAGRPDADAPSDLLGPRYESKTAGISFRPPITCKPKNAGPDEIVEYADDDRSWLLRVSRPTFPSPVPLISRMDATGKPTVGLLDFTVSELQRAQPGAKMLRQDMINVGSNYVGIIQMRFTLGAQKWLRQQAMVQANEQLYYVFNLTTPAGKVIAGKEDDPNAEPDPLEKQAVEVFNALVDSVVVIDRSKIKEDQNDRLYKSRALFTYWTPARFADILLGKQYFRIQRDGRDVGYTFIEEALEDHNLGGVGLKGVSAYARTHLVEQDPATAKSLVIDTGTFKFMSFDRRHETWTRTVVQQSQTDKGPTEMHTTEFGESVWETKRIPSTKVGVAPLNDPGAPLMRPADSHTLDVYVQAKGGTPEPKHMELPPFYLPQAAGSMLARLVVEKAYRGEPRNYLFASYVPESRDLRMHYVDVSEEKDVTFASQRLKAIVVSERYGLEGNPTLHYVTYAGKYLGSENKALKVLVIPTDEATILQLYPNARLTRPEPIQRTGAAPAAAAASPAPEPAPARGLPPAIR